MTYFIFSVLLIIAYKWWNRKLQNTSKKQISTSTQQFNNNNSEESLNRVVLQVLETIEIISTTKNVDVLSSRFEFLLKKYPQLVYEYHHPNYRNEALQTLDTYKQLYYNKVILEEQLQVITDPGNFDLDSYICNSLLNCFNRNYKFQQAQIDNLKTQRGKNGRYKKLLANIEITSNLIEEYSLQNTAYYQTRLDSKRLEITEFIVE